MENILEIKKENIFPPYMRDDLWNFLGICEEAFSSFILSQIQLSIILGNHFGDFSTFHQKQPAKSEFRNN
jgi:hypothetical protein